ncbi:MAG: hypothetical protein ABFC75_01540 [Rectinema sp.]
MDSHFEYKVLSSALHDAEAVERLFSSYAPLLEKEGGIRLGAGDGGGNAGLPSVLFILTGGTEALALAALDAGKVAAAAAAKTAAVAAKTPALAYAILVAHPLHNSLPAAMEILARVRQDGGKGSIVFLSGPGDEAGVAVLRDTLRAASALAAVSALRIGAIGSPSDWLVASAHSPGTVAATWGASLIPVRIEELRDKLATIEAAAGDVATEEFRNTASWCREPKKEEIARAGGVYLALKSIAAAHRLDALTLRCFDLVQKDGTTGCYALSRLADEGIDAGCEGDVPSIIALALMRRISGSPSWMANPSSIEPRADVDGKGEILLAHCTVPRNGLESYGIRSHFESGIGVAIAGRMPKGPVTLLRLGGSELNRAWIAEGEMTESPSGEGLCRTQARIRVEARLLSELLEDPLGNHIVVARGHWGGTLARVMAALNVRG